MRKILFLIFLLFWASTFANEERKQSHILIDRITALMGSSAVEMAVPFVESYSDNLANYFMKIKPHLPQEARAVIKNEISLYWYQQLLINSEVKKFNYKIFEQHFTNEELEQLINFYQGPTGEKLLKLTPEFEKANLANVAPSINPEEGFTEREISELQLFYSTSLGKRLAEFPSVFEEEYAKHSEAIFSSIEANLVDNLAPLLNKRMRENGW